MGSIQKIRRLRVNPIEVSFFAVTLAIFGNSIYQLCFDFRSFRAEALTPMTGRITTESVRSLASAPTTTPSSNSTSTSTSRALLTLEVQCNETKVEKNTSAERLRLKGPLCGASEMAQLNHVAIQNQSNHLEATVFTDVKAGEYSTDYINLAQGKNVLQLEFSYWNSKTFTQELTITKN